MMQYRNDPFRFLQASVNKQTSDIDDRRPQMPGGEDIISVFPVGLDHDKILHARTLIGDEAQRMRLVFNLEVDFFIEI